MGYSDQLNLKFLETKDYLSNQSLATKGKYENQNNTHTLYFPISIYGTDKTLKFNPSDPTKPNIKSILINLLAQYEVAKNNKDYQQVKKALENQAKNLLGAIGQFYPAKNISSHRIRMQGLANITQSPDGWTIYEFINGKTGYLKN